VTINNNGAFYDWGLQGHLPKKIFVSISPMILS
jgi:hypothetical protein